MTWTAYLSCEIHIDWCDKIVAQALELEFPVAFTLAVINHEESG